MASISFYGTTSLSSSSATCSFACNVTDACYYRVACYSSSAGYFYSTQWQGTGTAATTYQTVSMTELTSGTTYTGTATLQWKSTSGGSWASSGVSTSFNFTTTYESHTVQITAGTGISKVYGKRDTDSSYTSSSTSLNITTTSSTSYIDYQFSVESGYSSPYYMRYNDASGNYYTMETNSTGEIDTISYDRDITFYATPTTYYTITTVASPSAGGTVTGDGTYASGTTCTLRAIPSTGYVFSKWLCDGVECSSSQSYTFAVTGSFTYTAVFQAITYTLSANPGIYGNISSLNGWTSGSSGSATRIYNYCSQISTLPTITPNEGYTFDGWYNSDGDEVTTSTIVSSSYTITANYSLKTYTIARYASPNEGGTVSGPTSAEHGSSVTLTATPNAGYKFVKWYYGDTTYSTDSTYTFTITGSGTYIAKFELDTYTVDTACGDFITSITPSSVVLTVGDSCNFAATVADPTYSSWLSTSTYDYMNKYTYSVQGWSITSGSGTFSSTTSASTTFTPASDSTIKCIGKGTGVPYAWRNKVTYNANGGSGSMEVSYSEQSTSSAEAAKSVTISSNSFTRSGYVFTGWNTAADGTGTAYEAGTTTITTNITLYAQWAKVDYYLTSVEDSTDAANKVYAYNDYSGEFESIAKNEIVDCILGRAF